MKPLHLLALGLLATVSCSPGESESQPDKPRASPGIDTSSFEAPVALPSSTFAGVVAASDSFEIEAAQLALSRSASEPVRAFAREMIAAHGQSSADLKATIEKTGEQANAVYSREQQSTLALLRTLPADRFDRVYLEGQVAAHEQALKVLENFPAADDALGNFARRTIPAVRRHLSHARRLVAAAD